jgi:hypothetical protein
MIYIFLIWVNKETLKFLKNQDRWEWSKGATTGFPPTARHGHSSVLVGQKLFVFGGKANGNLLNDLNVLDLCTLSIIPLSYFFSHNVMVFTIRCWKSSCSTRTFHSFLH